MRRPTLEERDRISNAVHAAEAGTSGEIVTIVADHSDAYHDIALLYAGLAALLVPIIFAAWPVLASIILDRFTGGWGEAQVRDVMLLAFCGIVLVFLLKTLALAYLPLRLACVPRAVRRRRVRRRAIELFKVGTESRTTGRTGILIYLSLGERMAEIVADEAIHARVADTEWGDAMAVLIADVRAARIADGMIAAVGKIGVLLAANLPRADDDVNELPDRLIEL